jgi:hypothetical protein
VTVVSLTSGYPAAVIFASDIGSVLIGVLFVLALISFVIRKLSALNSTRCIHCGHDSALPGWPSTDLPNVRP